MKERTWRAIQEKDAKYAESLKLPDLEEPGVTMADLYDIVVRIEHKVDLLARRLGAYTTLEQMEQRVSAEEKDSLRG